MSQSYLPSPDVLPSNLQLEVIDGVHSGVALELEDGDYSIGSKADADIVLRDEGVAAQHVIICIDGKDIRAEAIGGGFRVGDEDIEAGHGYRLRLPAALTIGDATIKLSRQNDHSGFFDKIPFGEKIAARPAAAALSVLGCTLAIIAAFYSFQPPRPGSDNPPIATDSALETDGAIKTAAIPLAGEAGANAEVTSAAQQLSAKLKEAGLDDIELKTDGMHIEATGQMNERNSSEWGSIQRWFDRTFAPGVLLTTNVIASPAAADPRLQIQAIWYGDHPYIIADNGIRYYEGSVLDSGWLLQSINNEGIMLKKNEDIFTLSYK